MKKIPILILLILSLGAASQTRYDWNHYDSLIAEGAYNTAYPEIRQQYDTAWQQYVFAEQQHNTALCDALGLAMLHAALHLTTIDYAINHEPIDSAVMRYRWLANHLSGTPRSVAAAFAIRHLEQHRKNDYRLPYRSTVTGVNVNFHQWSLAQFNDTIRHYAALMLADHGDWHRADLCGYRLLFQCPDTTGISLSDLLAQSLSDNSTPGDWRMCDSTTCLMSLKPLRQWADYPLPDSTYWRMRLFHLSALTHLADSPHSQLAHDLIRLNAIPSSHFTPQQMPGIFDTLIHYYQSLPGTDTSMAELLYKKAYWLWDNRKYLEAHQCCLQCLQQYPQAPLSDLCQTLKERIEQPVLNISADRNESPQRSRLAIVGYSNLSRIHLRIVPKSIDPDNYIDKELLTDTLLQLPVVKAWQQELPTYSDYQMHEAMIAIPPLPEGVFLLLCSDSSDGHSSCCQMVELLSTDCMVISYDQQTSTHKHRHLTYGEGRLVDRVTGLPIAHRRMAIESEASGRRRHTRTDASGHFRFSLRPGDNSWEDFLFLVQCGDTLIHIDNIPSYIASGSVNSHRTTASLLTDKPVYRLGEQVHVCCVLSHTDITGKSRQLSMRTLKGRKVTLYLRDKNYKEIDSVVAVTDAFGQCSATFTIPEEGMNGRWSIVAKDRKKQTIDSKTLRVEAYKQPRFAVTLHKEGGPYLFGQPVHLKGTVTAYSGAPMSGTKVSYNVATLIDRFDFMDYGSVSVKETVTGDDGTFDITFTPQRDTNFEQRILQHHYPANWMDTYVFMTQVFVTDAEGEQQTANLAVHVGDHNGILTPTGTSPTELSFTYTDLDGAPLEGAVRLQLQRLHHPDTLRHLPPICQHTEFDSTHWVGSEEEFRRLFPHYTLHPEEYDPLLWEAEQTLIDTTTPLRCLKVERPLAAGSYRLRLSVGDSIVGQQVLFYDKPGEAPSGDTSLLGIRTNSNRAYLTTRDTLRIHLGSGYRHQPIYYRITLGCETLDDGMKILDGCDSLVLPLTGKQFLNAAGPISVSLAAVRNGRSTCANFSRTILNPDHYLQISTETFRDKLQPGAGDTWTFRILGNGGTPAKANLALTLFDQSLLKFGQLSNDLPTLVRNISGGITMLTPSHSLSDGERLVGTFSLQAPPPDTRHARMLKAESHYRELLMRRYAGQCTLKGCVIDGLTGEPIPFVSIIVKHNNATIKGLQTDFDGMFVVSKLAAGNYTMEIAAVGYQRMTHSIVLQDTAKTPIIFNVAMTRTATQLHQVMVKDSHVPIIEIGEAQSEMRLSSDDIAHMPGTSEESIMAAVGGVDFCDGGSGTARGENGMVNLTGSVRKRTGVNVPKEAIAEIKAIPNFEETEALLSSVALRQNLATTAFFEPALHSDDSGRVSISFTMPDALTRWELRGIAWTPRMQQGSILREVQTQRELMVQPLAPRFLRQGDTMDFRAKVSNLTDSAQPVRVALQLSDPADGKVRYAAPLQSLTLDAHSSRSVSFRIVVPDSLHLLTYTIALHGKCHSDGEQQQLPVLGNRIRLTESHLLHLNGGDTATPSILQFNLGSLDHPANTHIPDTLTLQFCSDPIAYALQAMPHFSRHRSPSNIYRATRLYVNTLEQHLRATRTSLSQQSQLQQLFDGQHGDGGWSWLSGDKNSSPYITRTIMRCVGEIRLLNPDLYHQRMLIRGVRYLDRWAAEQYTRIKDDPKRQHLSSSEMLDYLYVRQLFPDLHMDSLTQAACSFFNQQVSRIPDCDLTLRACAQRSLTHLRSGDTLLARQEAIRLRESALHDDELGMYWRDNTVGLYWWQRPYETQALMVDLFADVLHDWTSVAQLQQWILQQQRTTHWGSDLGTASAIHALCRSSHDWKGIPLANPVSIAVGGTLLQPQPDSTLPCHYRQQWSGAETSRMIADSTRITLTKTTPGPSWGALHYQYEDDIDNIAAHEMGIRLSECYCKVDAHNSLIPVTDSTPLYLGDRIRIHIDIFCNRTLDYLLLRDSRPACLEPADTKSGWHYNQGLHYYADIHNTSHDLYIDRLEPGHYCCEYDCRLSASGTFATGITTIESTFAPGFRSRTANRQLRVISPDGQSAKP